MFRRSINMSSQPPPWPHVHWCTRPWPQAPQASKRPSNALPVSEGCILARLSVCMPARTTRAHHACRMQATYGAVTGSSRGAFMLHANQGCVLPIALYSTCRKTGLCRVTHARMRTRKTFQDASASKTHPPQCIQARHCSRGSPLACPAARSFAGT